MVSGHDGLRGVGDRGQKCPEKGPCYTELNPGWINPGISEIGCCFGHVWLVSMFLMHVLFINQGFRQFWYDPARLWDGASPTWKGGVLKLHSRNYMKPHKTYGHPTLTCLPSPTIFKMQASVWWWLISYVQMANSQLPVAALRHDDPTGIPEGIQSSRSDTARGKWVVLGAAVYCLEISRV